MSITLRDRASLARLPADASSKLPSAAPRYRAQVTPGSLSERGPVTLLELLTRAARTRVVPADIGPIDVRRYRGLVEGTRAPRSDDDRIPPRNDILLRRLVRSDVHHLVRTA